jgi:uncharacterized protein (DUF433 family)
MPFNVDSFDRITSDPDVQGGKPCIRGLRITVRRILDILAQNPSWEDLRRGYPELEDEDIRQVLAHACADPFDTSPDARRHQFALWRGKGLAARARMTFEASDALRATLESGVRHRHPAYSDRQVRLAVARLMLGAELFAKAHPDEAIEP